LSFFERISTSRWPITIFATKQTKSRQTSVLLASGLAVAATFGISAILNHYLTRKTERENPPEGKFVRVQGLNIHYVAQGDGPPVVMFHGNGSALQDFQCAGLVDRLSSKHRVILFDRPGFGQTGRPKGVVWTPEQQAAIFADALSKLGVEEPVIVGHSWGTLVAVAIAQEARLRCRGLVLVSGYYLPSARIDLIAGSVGAIPVIGPVLCHTVLPLLARASWPELLRNLFAPRSTKSFAGFPKELTFRPSQLSASAHETAMLNPAVVGIARRLRGLRKPVTIMAGTADRVIDANHSATLHHHLPGSSLELLPLQGHMVHHTDRERVVRAIEQIMFPQAEVS